MTKPLIDFATETTYGLSQAARLLPPGRGSAHVHAGTLIRWILAGCRAPCGGRVYLRAARIGSRWITSKEALAEFQAALTPRRSDADAPPPIRSAGQARRGHEESGRHLDSIGIR